MKANNIKETLYTLQEKGLISWLDVHFGEFMAGRAGINAWEVSLAAALLSNHTRQGDICLDLARIGGKPANEGEDDSIICPETNSWFDKLLESGVVGEPGNFMPMILDKKQRLYLHRYWQYQERLAAWIRQRVSEKYIERDLRTMERDLTRLFPGVDSEDFDRQKAAAFTALTKKFCVITGGPGTGKTTTVAGILALLLEYEKDEQHRIALAAPTGKAAARLMEAVMSAKSRLDCADDIRSAIPEEASTIHRLLGAISGSPFFRYNERNPLLLNTLVVDEASMVDMALMSKLIQALPSESRLILLGDKHQLASVEAGAVLGDICDTGRKHGFSINFNRHIKSALGREIPHDPTADDGSVIQDSIIQLKRNYRFSEESGIAVTGNLINKGDSEGAISALKNKGYKDIELKPIFAEELEASISEAVINGYRGYLKPQGAHEALEKFEEFRVLCALREGPFGVKTINNIIENILKKAKIVKPDQVWYHGRPVMVTRNDYNLSLFNGDVGIAIEDSDSNAEIRVCFPMPDGGIRKLHPMRLPDHETVYAMTIHKSQGSEFDHALMILPYRDSPLLTRELLYTGITRARKRVTILSRENIFRTAIDRTIERMSGLRDALWERQV